jgi:phosphoglycolate phosphatase-like HAD superfamily hydrolase
MAQNAGVPSLGAGYGAHPREGLLEFSPLACTDSFTELRNWLREHA